MVRWSAGDARLTTRGTIVEIPPYRLDRARGVLLHGEREIKLRPRTWGVLTHLVDHAGEVVGKDELMRAVWSDAVVSEQTLSTSIAELRRALVDDPRAPRFIETIHGRGFRFLVVPEDDEAERDPVPDPDVVGRAAELARLSSALEAASAGERRVVFVAGESGMGKTTLVEAFLRAMPVRARTAEGVRIVSALGQCVEFSGPGEPFMPVVGALRVLSRGTESRWVIPTLRRLLPGWMAELLGAAEPTQASADAAPEENRARALRLLAEALEELGRDTTLVLVVEDLHWSDASTLDLINLFARRTNPCRVLLVGTLRPEEGKGAHPQFVAMVRELVRKGRAEVVELEALEPSAVRRLVEHRLGEEPLAADLAERLRSWTGGIPFLLAELVTQLREQGRLARVDGEWRLEGPPLEDFERTPTAVLDAVEARLARLVPAERAALEIASVAGPAFEPAAVAAVTVDEPSGLDIEAVESLCERLAGAAAILLREMPDATGGPVWRFRHALYRETLRARIVPSRLRRIHRALGEWHAKQEGAPPTVLAHHFEAAGEAERALAAYQEAASTARDRRADPEAIGLLRAALRCVEALPDEMQRRTEELSVRLALAGSILNHAGYTHPEVVPLYTRALALAEDLDQPVLQAVAVGGLFFAHLSAARVDDGHAAARRLGSIVRGMPAFFVDSGQTALGVALFARGDLAGARAALERPADFRATGAVQVDVNVSVLRLGALATVQAHQGDLAAGERSIAAMLEAAGDAGRVYDLANAHRLAAEYYALVGDRERAGDHGTATIALSDEHEFGQLRSIGAVLLGWARAVAAADRSALVSIAEALEDLDRRGYRLMRSTFCARQAEAALAVGDLETARSAVDAGLAHVRDTGERRHESDLHRVRAALRRASGDDEEAVRRSLDEALRVAREQGAPLFVLRALLEGARGSGRAAETDRDALRTLVEAAPPALSGADLDAARELLGL